MFLKLLKILLYKITFKKIICINTASGLGDYLYVRSYFKYIKQNNMTRDCKLVVLVTERWKDFAKKFDSKYVDIFFSFSNPHNPKQSYKDKTECFLLKLIKFDYCVNFYLKHPLWKDLNSYIRSKKNYYEAPNINSHDFWAINNNKIFNQFLELPENFKHSIDIYNSKQLDKFKMLKYAIIVPSGCSFGEMTYSQIKISIKYLIEKQNLKVLLLGVGMSNLYKKLCSDEELYKYNDLLINGMNIYKSYEIPFLIKYCQFILTPNTANYHIAYMLNIPMVALSQPIYSTIYKDTKNVITLIDDNIQNIKENSIINSISYIMDKHKKG